jgi:hypothetical protein
MNESPQRLPQPTEHPRRPLSERLHLAAISVASLLLGIFGVIMMMASVAAVWSFFQAPRGVQNQVLLLPALMGWTALLIAYLLRWCLHRERQRSPK